jgi:hypothetical protein
MPTTRRKLRTARVVRYNTHSEMRMLGFEMEDLDALKTSITMRWDRDDQVWLVHRAEFNRLMATLEELGFVVRWKDERR